MKKNILFFYTDSKFKKFIKDNNENIFSKSLFLKGLFLDYKDKKDFSEIEVLSIFIDIKIDKEELKSFPNLKYIITRSTGRDHINEVFCKKKNIQILNIPEYGSKTVAEFSLGMLLSLLKNLNDNKNQRGLDLNQKTVGVIGAGRIGRHFIKLIESFGVNILISDPNKDKKLAQKYNAKYVSLNELLKKSDIISFYVPLIKKTKHLISKKHFKKMKDGVILINVARGGLIDTKALYDNLINKKIFKLGVDILEEEWDLYLKNTKNLSKKRIEILKLNKKIIKMKNVLYTEHQAYNTKEAVERIWNQTLEHIQNIEL